MTILTDKLTEKDSLYPLNQDGATFSSIMYSNSLEFICRFITQTDIDPEVAIAQVEKDIRMMLDQRFIEQ